MFQDFLTAVLSMNISCCSCDGEQSKWTYVTILVMFPSILSLCQLHNVYLTGLLSDLTTGEVPGIQEALTIGWFLPQWGPASNPPCLTKYIILCTHLTPLVKIHAQMPTSLITSILLPRMPFPA